jgi:hypothetical protein
MPPRWGWGGSYVGGVFYNHAAPNGAKGGEINFLGCPTVLFRNRHSKRAIPKEFALAPKGTLS